MNYYNKTFLEMEEGQSNDCLFFAHGRLQIAKKIHPYFSEKSIPINGKIL
jgi:hypothetical protein